jgi:outer membrane protein assembly factor BamA
LHGVRAWLALCLTCLSSCAVAATAPAQAGHGFWSLFDGTRLPFVPVPEIDVNPNSGTTLGVIPVWIKTDDQQQIRRIIAPDLIHNPYFGFGARARIFAFPSADVLWSVVGGGKQRVEREFDGRYESGRSRNGPWSIALAAVFDRSGTPRFYGFGNRSPVTDQTNYTKQLAYLQAGLGRNFGRTWQLAFTFRARSVEVTPGSLAGITTIESRFGRLQGTGTSADTLQRLSVIFDNRDDETIPRHGFRLVAYAGMAARRGFLNSSFYSEAGLDTRGYWRLDAASTVAAHVALRYLPSSRHAPFWALSSIGGDASEIDGSQPLRGFGESRFYDRDAFSANCEWRRKVGSVEAIGTRIDLEITPFVDVGKVFSRQSASPLSDLHKVGGLGVRAIAAPTVVAYVDFGYGSEGLAVFTGINYPF